MMPTHSPVATRMPLFIASKIPLVRFTAPEGNPIGVAVDYVEGAVRRAAVDEDIFQVSGSDLPENASDGPLEGSCCVVTYRNDAELHEVAGSRSGETVSLYRGAGTLVAG